MIRTKKNLIDFTCQKCGETVKIEKWRLKDTRKYCNRECYLEVVAEQKREREAKKPKKKKQVKKTYMKICGFCEEEFEVQYKVKQKFCSQQCANRFNVDSKKVPIITKFCLFCGEEYETRNRYQKFCGRDCSSANYHSRSKTEAKKIAKSLPVLPSKPTIPIWQVKIYLDKKVFKKFYHKGTVQTSIRKIKPSEKFVRMDIHIRFIGESKLEND